jgi:acetolactate synthase-1/2/3 large subunit
LADAFGFTTCEISNQQDLQQQIRDVLAEDSCVFCVVRMPGFLQFSPKLSSKRLPDGTLVSARLEDMFPFLERDEFNKHMLQGE